VGQPPSSTPWAEFSEPAEILPFVNKRLTLNLLIQGAAAHTFVTAHHLVRDDLDALQPGLTDLYDRAVVSMHLNYWIGDVGLTFGPPWRYWGSIHRPTHPFHRHPLLATHGGMLSRESKAYLVRRAREKRVISTPGPHYGQSILFFMGLIRAEGQIKSELAPLATRAASTMWGIDEDRLDAHLTRDAAFGRIRTPRTNRGVMLRAGAIGWGGVQRRNGQFVVVAKSWFWPLLSHELTKGIVELICLHGLCDLSKKDYAAVVGYADHIEYEIPMLQAGAELWRRFLAVIPPGQRLPQTLMHVARLEPLELEQLMMNVVAAPDAARRYLMRPPFHEETPSF
jgi:hypothetical protein